MSSVRVLVASHIRLYREELERGLRESAQLTLVGSASSAAEAIEQSHTLGADVVLLDMAMTGAVLVAKEVARRAGCRRVVALGMPEDETQVLICAQIGIAGCVTRDGSVQDVVAAIASVGGDVHRSTEIAISPIGHIAAASTKRPPRTGNGALTAREAQTLKLIQQGMSNKMISHALGIQLPTVKNHVHSILVKLEIHSRAEAILLLSRPKSQKGASVDVRVVSDRGVLVDIVSA